MSLHASSFDLSIKRRVFEGWLFWVWYNKKVAACEWWTTWNMYRHHLVILYISLFTLLTTRLLWWNYSHKYIFVVGFVYKFIFSQSHTADGRNNSSHHRRQICFRLMPVSERFFQRPCVVRKMLDAVFPSARGAKSWWWWGVIMWSLLNPRTKGPFKSQKLPLKHYT